MPTSILRVVIAKQTKTPFLFVANHEVPVEPELPAPGRYRLTAAWPHRDATVDRCAPELRYDRSAMMFTGAI